MMSTRTKVMPFKGNLKVYKAGGSIINAIYFLQNLASFFTICLTIAAIQARFHQGIATN